MTRILEKFLDGEEHNVPAVRFKNPTDQPVRFVGREAIPREMTVQVGRKPDGSPRYASRAYEVNIGPGETTVVPAEVANVLQSFTCADCGGWTPWRFGPANVARGKHVCTDATHHRVLLAGLAPQLQVVADDGTVAAVEMHPNLGPEPAPQYDASDLHARTMRRLAGRGAQ